jgi:hypothetical protein
MRKEIINSKKVVYYFDSITDMQNFSNQVLQRIPFGSYAYKTIQHYTNEKEILKRQLNESIKRRLEWFGVSDTQLDWLNSGVTNYNKMQELQCSVDSLTKNISKLDIIDIDQSKRIKFTEKEIGIFSYDLASLGLIKVYEYYSNLLQRIVSGNFIIKENKAFYFVGQKYIPRHEVKYVADKSGFYSNILGRLVDKKDLECIEKNNSFLYFYLEQQEIPKHIVEQKHKIGKNGKPMFTTTFKKCFINIEKVKNPLPRIDLIVVPAFNGAVTASQIFYNSVSLITICEKLSKSNVNYRLLTSYCGATPQDLDCEVFSFINIKNENQILDINQIAILSSDARFYRYENFKLKYAMQYDNGWENKMDTNIAIPINDVDKIKNTYLEYLSKQTSQSDRDAAKRPNTKIVIPRALNMQEAQDAYDTVMNQISKLTK